MAARLHREPHHEHQRQQGAQTVVEQRDAGTVVGGMDAVLQHAEHKAVAKNQRIHHNLHHEHHNLAHARRSGRGRRALLARPRSAQAQAETNGRRRDHRQRRARHQRQGQP